MTAQRERFPFISADAFINPTDRTALASLQKIPAFPFIVRKFNEFAIDNIYYQLNASSSVLCSPKQFPTLYGMMKEATEILHVAEPELYIVYDYSYNAMTAGVNRTFITIHSSLIKDFTDDELRFVIGHEIGHIKCGHVLYMMMARMLMPLMEAVGEVTLGIGKLLGVGLVISFYQWLQQAELSCDRAGLLVCQNPDAAYSALTKLGCGNTGQYNHEMNVAAFMEQSKNYTEQKGMDGMTRNMVYLLYNLMMTHPQVVYRMKGLQDWHNSGAYDTIMSRQYTQDVTGQHQMGRQVRCTTCNISFSAAVNNCPKCGAPLGPAPEASTAQTSTPTCRHCNSILVPGAKFCMDCGKSA